MVASLDLIATPSTLSASTSEADAAQAQDLVTQLRRDFEERDKLYEAYEAVLHGDTVVKIPEAYQKTAVVIHSPLAGHIVNTITAALSVNAPTVQFQPTGFGTQPTENATARERFFEASWLRQERESKRRLFRLFMYSLVAKGEGVLKTMERSKSAWSGYREYSRELQKALDHDRRLDHDARDRYFNHKTEDYKKERAPYPISTTDVIPESFYYLKGLDGFTVCAEVKDVPYYDTLLKFKQGLDGRGHVVPQAMGLPLSEWQSVMRGAGNNLRMVEVWRPDECIYYLLGPGQTSSQGNSRAIGRGSEVQRIKNHGYGDPLTGTLRGPYFHALGTTTANRLPHRAGLGVLYGYLDLFPLMDSMLSIAHNNAVMTGFASFKKNRPPQEQAIRPRSPGDANPYGEDGDEDDEYDEVIEPGMVYPDDIGPLEMPRAGVDFEKFLTLVRGLLELALPSVVQGVVTGDESGYALNQASHLARLAWDPILDNAEFALSERVGFESYVIERYIGERVYAHGEVASKTNARRRTSQMVSIGPKELGGNHNYTVKLDPQTPSNRSLEVRLHREMVDAGFEAQADAIEALGNNVDEVNRQRLFEQFQQLPQVQQRIFERTLQKLGWNDAEQIRQAKEQLALADAQAQATGQPPPGMAGPGMEGVPPGGPPSGLPGEHLGAAGQVYDPAMGNMPQTPTPAGSVTGVGPGGPGPGGPGGLPASLPGAPSNPGMPARNIPQPGM